MQRLYEWKCSYWYEKNSNSTSSEITVTLKSCILIDVFTSSTVKKMKKKHGHICYKSLMTKNLASLTIFHIH